MSASIAAGGTGTAAPAGSDALSLRLEAHRRELVLHCGRILGSAAEADDAAQEALVRAWRGFDRFEGRATLRSWLYRIATNVCLDMRKAKQRRAHPMDPLSGPAIAGRATAGATGGSAAAADGIQPDAVGGVARPEADPAEQAVAREAVRLALVVTLQVLPPRQRSVLILREVLRWPAAEVAELLGTSVASVNSALERARFTLAARLRAADQPRPLDDEERALLGRFAAAFQHHDVDSLVSLVR